MNDLKRRVAEKGPYEVPCVVSGDYIATGDVAVQVNPGEHKLKLCSYHNATKEIVRDVCLNHAKKCLKSRQSLKRLKQKKAGKTCHLAIELPSFSKLLI